MLLSVDLCFKLVPSAKHAFDKTMENQEIDKAVQLANAEFIKGFISGQIILSALIFFLLKVFLFRNAKETKQELELNKQKKLKVSVETEQKYSLNTVILSKLGYNVGTHAKESLDWVNVLFALLVQNLRNEHMISKFIHSIQQEMNSSKPTNILGPIIITEFTLGNEYPILKDAVVTNDGKLVVNIDFSFNDQITLALETMILVNWPRQHMASLPISLQFQMLKLQGTICIEFNPLDVNENQTISVYIRNDSILEFGVGSLIGNKTKVKDLPKLTQMLQDMLKKSFYQKMVYPSKKVVQIPRFMA